MPGVPNVTGSDRNMSTVGQAVAGDRNDPLNHARRAVVVGGTNHPINQSQARAQAGDRKKRIRIVGGGVGARQT
jgi:hypothetical protein